MRVESKEFNKYSVGDKSTINGRDLEIESVNYNIAPIGSLHEELLAYLTVINKQDTFKYSEKKLDEIFDRMYKYYDELSLREFEYIKQVEVDDGNGSKKTLKVNAVMYYGTYNINLEKKDFHFLIAEDLQNGEEYTKDRNINELLSIYDEIVANRGSWQILVSPFEDRTWISRNPQMQGYRIENNSVKYFDYEDNFMYLDSKVGEDIFTLDGMNYSETKVNYYENRRDGILELIVDDTTKIYLEGVESTAQNGEVLKNEVIEDKEHKKKQKLERAKIGKAKGNRIGIKIKKENINPETGKKFGFFSLKKSNLYVNPYLYLSLTEAEKSQYQEMVMKTKGEGDYIQNGFGNRPSLSFDDETVKKLFKEAEKHVGKRYVFGANGPRNFDCSSFVCWSFTHSGVRKMPRTTAYRIYKDYCNPIRPDEAKPGDIIFFHSTYTPCPEPISHVGIYAGNGMMLHAGDPIQYTSIKHWKNHFYAYGRPKK